MAKKSQKTEEQEQGQIQIQRFIEWNIQDKNNQERV